MAHRRLETQERAPIDALMGDALRLLENHGRVTITAPTGSGKSTRVPMWCTGEGSRVLVVEPRRLACRSLARYVAHLTGSEVGREVGYAVRHDASYTDQSRIVFATPGTVLRMIQQRGIKDGRGRLLGQWDVLVLDEFHERQIEMDLLLAFALEAQIEKMIIMSATLDVHRLARFVGAEVLEGHGRMFPVEIEHIERPTLPEIKGLEARVVKAVDRALGFEGDVLVFLPGKREIEASRKALSRLAEGEGLEVLALHGDLPPKDQDRPFKPGSARRVILATNVAETSVTLPRIGVVVDSGLVRQTRYHAGRGVLKLIPIAGDSAEQRRGRAGRLGPGVCIRLWGLAGKLEPRTPPEILREDLTDTGLLVASCGFRFQGLRFLDPPAPYALQAGLKTLVRIGCVDESGQITDMGRATGRLPVDARQGRFLVEASRAVASGEAPSEVLHDAVDLIAALSVGRRLLQPVMGELSDSRQAWRAKGCDATLLILAMRHGNPRRDGLHPFALTEGRRIAEQLRGQLKTRGSGRGETVSRTWLARLWVRADPHSGYVRRKRGDAFGRDGAEIELPKSSLISEKVEAVVVPEVFSMKVKHKLVKISTCAIPTELRLFKDAGLGKDVLDNARIKGGALRCEVRRVFAGRTLDTREEIPTGESCVAGLKLCLMRGQLYRKTVEETRQRMKAWNLYRRLKRLTSPGAVEFEAWVSERIEALGVESGEDLALLMAEDFLWAWPQEMDAAAQKWLAQGYPGEFSIGDAAYEIEYSSAKRTVTLNQVKGKRRQPPPLTFLPTWPGWSIQWKRGNAISVLRR